MELVQPAMRSVQRVKICLLGLSKGGKTSLVRSITETKSVLVADEDRTIGIDRYPFQFTDTTNQLHEVIFWDFAGQDVYQVAIALFFSSKTLYLLCVDLSEYAKGFKPSPDATTWAQDAATQRLVEQQVLRWARMIFARQTDAHLVVIGTKSDLLAGNPTLLKQVETDLHLRIQEWCRAYARALDKSDPSRQQARQFYLQQTQIVSVATADGVAHARKMIEDMVVHKSTETLGLTMTPPYRSVLAALDQRRSEAHGQDAVKRKMNLLIPKVEKLVCELTQSTEVQEAEGVRRILRSLHDQGEVLWYDQPHAGPFKDVVIVDPDIVLDLVRELINHNYTDGSGPAYDALRERGEMKHSLLMTFTTWKSLCEPDDDLLFTAKTLMVFYQLAYPVGPGEMAEDSDLIVPTYWKSMKRSSDAETLPPVDSVYRHAGFWLYEVPAELSETIFDQFVVQSYSRSQVRTVTTSHVEARVNGDFVARIFFETGRGTKDCVRIEVFAISDAVRWRVVRFFVASMEIVLDGYPGLRDVSRHILLHASAQIGSVDSRAVEVVLKDFEDARALGLGVRHVRQTTPWLPPTLDWFAIKAWQKSNALTELDEKEKLDQVHRFRAAVTRLSTSSEKRRTLPALFVVYAQPDRMRVRLLSDLSGICHHEPIIVTDWKAKLPSVESWVQTGVTVYSTVSDSCVNKELLNDVLSWERMGRLDSGEQETLVHNMVGKPRSQRQGLTADTTKQMTASGLLRVLLGLEDGTGDEIGFIYEKSRLVCASTMTGEYVWASKQEIERVVEVKALNAEMVRTEMESAKTAALTPTPSHAAPTRLKFSLQITRATGVRDCDADKAVCAWELGPSPQRVLELGVTQQPVSSSKSVECASNKRELTWKNSFTLSNIVGYSTLRECELVLTLKRPRRWIKLQKVVGRGSLPLAKVLKDEKMQSTPFVVELTDGIVVEGVLVIEEQSCSPG